MALFGGGKSKEEKEQERLEEQRLKEEKEMNSFMQRYGLVEVNPEDLHNLRFIKANITGAGLMSFGNMLQGSKHTPTESYLSAIFQQNWIMLKELQRIRKALENK